MATLAAAQGERSAECSKSVGLGRRSNASAGLRDRQYFGAGLLLSVEPYNTLKHSSKRPNTPRSEGHFEESSVGQRCAAAGIHGPDCAFFHEATAAGRASEVDGGNVGKEISGCSHSRWFRSLCRAWPI